MSLSVTSRALATTTLPKSFRLLKVTSPAPVASVMLSATTNLLPLLCATLAPPPSDRAPALSSPSMITLDGWVMLSGPVTTSLPPVSLKALATVSAPASTSPALCA